MGRVRGDGKMDHRRTILSIFVSSPGDCAEERARVRALIARLDASPLAQHRRIALSSILWEDLPGGEGAPGDAQQRIRHVLDHFGLRKYAIYIGFMKDRVGTPTSKASSGTLEELEEARRSRRTGGAPSEVLWYFLGDGHERVPEVADVRHRLDTDGFIYHHAADAEELDRRLEQHLTALLAEWSTFGRRLRRLWAARRLVCQVAVGVILAMAAILYVAVDLRGYVAVKSATREGPLAALDALDAEQARLLVHASAARAIVERCLEERLPSLEPIEASLDLFARWAGRPAADDAAIRAVRRELVARLRDELLAACTADGTNPSRALWQRAFDAGVWSDDGSREVASARLVAARARIEQRIDAGEDRDDAGPVPPCPDDVRALAKEMRARIHDLAGWKTRRARVVLCVLAEDWATLEGLADAPPQDEASGGARPIVVPGSGVGASVDTDPFPEVDSFVANAPVAMVVAWLARQFAGEGAPPTSQVVGEIDEGARRRADPTIAISLWDHAVAGRLPADHFHFDRDLLYGVGRDDAVMRACAAERAEEWVAAGKLPRPFEFDVLGPYVPYAALDPGTRSSLASLIVRALREDPDFENAGATAIAALRDLGTDSATEWIGERVAAFADDRIFGGHDERAVLIPMLRSDRVSARKIAQIARAECAGDEPSAELMRSGEERVQTAYLRLLLDADVVDADELGFARVLEDARLAPQKANGLLSLPPRAPLQSPEFEHALEDFVTHLPDASFVELLGEPRWGDIVTRDPAAARRRWRDLFHLAAPHRTPFTAEAAQRLAAVVVEWRFFDRDLLVALARLGGGPALDVLRSGAAEAVTIWPILHAAAGLEDALRTDVESLAHSSDDATFDTLVHAVLPFPGDLRGALVAKLSLLLDEDTRHLDRLMFAATELPGFDPSIARHAERQLGEGSSLEVVAAAAGYLGGRAPEQLESLLRDDAVAGRFTAAFRGVSLERRAFARARLAWSGSRPLPPVLARLARAGMVAIQARDESEVPAESEAVAFENAWFSEPLLELVARFGAREELDPLLRHALGGATDCEVLGRSTDAARIGRLCLFDCARRLAGRLGLQVPSEYRSRLIAYVGDSSPAISTVATDLLLLDGSRHRD